MCSCARCWGDQRSCFEPPVVSSYGPAHEVALFANSTNMFLIPTWIFRIHFLFLVINLDLYQEGVWHLGFYKLTHEQKHRFKDVLWLLAHWLQLGNWSFLKCLWISGAKKQEYLLRQFVFVCLCGKLQQSWVFSGKRLCWYQLLRNYWFRNLLNGKPQPEEERGDTHPVFCSYYQLK